ncbi:MAG TPA: hypothetical protein VN764_06585, partial [Polyangiaceae bacterium]|nr:hypothetical protein [Polyangiaceae bacterium]
RMTGVFNSIAIFSRLHRREIATYTRRLLSHDSLTRQQLDLYVQRRRQSLLFFALHCTELLQEWQRTHFEAARFCGDEDWQSLPTSGAQPWPPAFNTVTELANVGRVLTWWRGEDARRSQPRLRLVTEPSVLAASPPENSLEVLCLSDHSQRILAAPCREGKHYHALTDVAVFDDMPALTGTLVTNLDERDVTRLRIRQPLAYHLQLSDIPCACGRPFPTLEL